MPTIFSQAQLKRRVARLLCHPLMGRTIAVFFRDRIPNRGVRISTRNVAIVPAIKAALFWGVYESAEIRFVQRFLRIDCDVIELGSSLGVVAAHISRRLAASHQLVSHQLVCVEANPALLPIIRQNARISSRTARVSVVHGAVYYPISGSSDSISLILGDDNTVSSVGDWPATQKSVQVPTTTLSKIVEEHHIEKFVLVSDIEGAEVGFIQKDGLALSKCQQLIIELHDTEWAGQRMEVEHLREKLENQHGFLLKAQYGPVFVFERA